MKTSKILAVAALSLLTIAGAQAETYQGVQTVNSVRSRADVAAEAQVAARSGNVYGDDAFAGVAPAMTSGIDRSAARREAIETARLGNVYGDDAFAGVLSVSGSHVDRATVRAEARAAARANVAVM